jgi:hypothetical protein
MDCAVVIRREVLANHGAGMSRGRCETDCRKLSSKLGDCRKTRMDGLARIPKPDTIPPSAQDGALNQITNYTFTRLRVQAREPLCLRCGQRQSGHLAKFFPDSYRLLNEIDRRGCAHARRATKLSACLCVRTARCPRAPLVPIRGRTAQSNTTQPLLLAWTWSPTSHGVQDRGRR